ncbi:hypothetical protein JCM14450A_28050 [Geobacillus stearothermophilus]
MIEKLVETVNGWLWSPFLIAFIVCCGLYFSIRTRFLQIRHVKEMVRLVTTGKGSEAGVSSFQALTMSLSGRIGVGNVAGTATGIAYGGAGRCLLDVGHHLYRSGDRVCRVDAGANL